MEKEGRFLDLWDAITVQATLCHLRTLQEHQRLALPRRQPGQDGRHEQPAARGLCQVQARGCPHQLGAASQAVRSHCGDSCHHRAVPVLALLLVRRLIVEEAKQEDYVAFLDTSVILNELDLHSEA